MAKAKSFSSCTNENMKKINNTNIQTTIATATTNTTTTTYLVLDKLYLSQVGNNH